jgi:hypothetical protein
MLATIIDLTEVQIMEPMVSILIPEGCVTMCEVVRKGWEHQNGHRRKSLPRIDGHRHASQNGSLARTWLLNSGYGDALCGSLR